MEICLLLTFLSVCPCHPSIRGKFSGKRVDAGSLPRPPSEPTCSGAFSQTGNLWTNFVRSPQVLHESLVLPHLVMRVWLLEGLSLSPLPRLCDLEGSLRCQLLQRFGPTFPRLLRFVLCFNFGPFASMLESCILHVFTLQPKFVSSSVA